MIMSSTHKCISHVRSFREKRRWSQSELATLAGLSRPEVSAIENGRLVPSAAGALALARAFSCSVESLFQLTLDGDSAQPQWAWSPTESPARVWAARVGGSTLLYPVENCELGHIPHDGVWDGRDIDLDPSAEPARTLVIATCDPAVGLMASELARTENVRVIALTRSSTAALRLLAGGLVHGAGVHLADARDKQGNLRAARAVLGAGFQAIRVAGWQEGLALRPGGRSRTVRDVVKTTRRWVGREAGSGARQCQDATLAGAPAPRRVAHDHRGVAEAVRSSWADAGVCLRLVCVQAGLDFVPVREEPYDLCLPSAFVADARYAGLLRVLKSKPFRRLLADLPGYNTSLTGEVLSPSA